MRYVQMKDQQIPAVALGTWSWGTGKNGGDTVFGNSYHEEDLRPVYDAAMQAGLCLWDTAAVYSFGGSETILGSFLQQEARPALISTKFTPLDGQTDDAMRQMAQESIGRLHRDRFDLYWIHSPRDVERWTRQVIGLVKEGIVRHVGVSNHDLGQIRRAAEILGEAGIELAAVQNHYSLLYRASEHAGILDWCREHDVTFFSYMVLEQGALTGRFDPEHPFPAGTRRGEAFPPQVLGQIAPLIGTLRQVAAAHDADPAAVATAWAIAKGTVPIIGATKPHHVEGAVRAMQLQLEPDEVAELDRSAEATGVSVRGAWEAPM